jgi:succinate dehydrogenase/fumarate reductase flavoprotein subunit
LIFYFGTGWIGKKVNKKQPEGDLLMLDTVFTDVLVIGGGGAALRAAIEAARGGVKVDLVDKGKVGESGSSPQCLVGFSARFNQEDSDELFFQDWLRASGYICDQNLVWEAVTRSRKAAEELEKMGGKFMKNLDGSMFLSKRAGHSAARGLMVESSSSRHTDVTRILRTEAEKRGVNFHQGIMVTGLLKKNRRVVGALGIDRKRNLTVFSANAVVLAAGGANRLYPNVADGIQEPQYRTTGDGFRLAFNAGAQVIDMEFAQFRDSPPAGPLYGAKYFNSLGERFMEKYDPQGLERAPRFAMVRAVYQEIMEGRGPITWKVEQDEMEKSRVPVGHEYADRHSVEITLQFQRLMGGARIDAGAGTSVAGLFAAGESAGGVHGGDRMQSNGFLDTQVFGAIAGRSAASLAGETDHTDISPALLKEEQARLARKGGSLDPAEFIRTVQKTMWEQAGVVREKINLQTAAKKLEQLRNEEALQLSDTDIFACLEANNLALTGEMVARAALAREETRSAQMRSDFPLADSNWVKHVCITKQGDKIKISTLPVITREH